MSEINPFEIYDYLTEARERVTESFKDKDVFDRYLQLLLVANIELQQVFKDLMQKRSLDTATGAQLDIIGRIVGQPRELIDTALLDYFAFDTYPTAAPYGDLSDPSEGGLYYSLGDPLAGNTLLNDNQYRLFIKAKIIKNNTNVTPDQYLDFLSFVFGATLSNVISESNAEFTVLIGKELTPFERVLVTYTSNNDGYETPFIPKPIGVRINYGQFDSTNFFAYQGAPGAEGFGDLSDPSVGGKYGQLF